MFGNWFKKNTDTQVTVKQTTPAVSTGAETALMKALGGKANLRSAQVVAATRLRVVVEDGKKFDRDAVIRAGGISAVVAFPGGVFHLLAGLNAPELAKTLR